MATTAKRNAATKTTKKTTTAKTVKVVPKSTSKTATQKVTAKPKTSNGSKNKVATPSSKKNSTKPNIALFIDVDNVGISRENLLEILFFVSGKYNVELCKLYGFSEDTLPGIKEIASDYNLITVGKMKFKTVGQNCLDSRILVDAYECAIKNAKTLDTIFVWCYPCDLAECFEKIIEQGVATATIDSRVFDCKNKFVSQTFKLYSAYTFGGNNQMYGQVQNSPTPTPIMPAEPEPQNKTTPTTATSETAMPETISALTSPAETNSVADNNELESFDNQPVPVLPRREIAERTSKPAQEKQPIDELDAIAAEINPAESIVDAISRKLNITRPNLAEVEQEMAERKEVTETISLLDMIKKAGIIDDDTDKPQKYEDTIGDLWYNTLLCVRLVIVNYEKCGLNFTKNTGTALSRLLR